MKRTPSGRAVSRELAAAGCVAAEDEARELIDAAEDVADLDRMLRRRLTGEPLAWITRRVSFCGLELNIEPGVYVPRWQSEPLARLGGRLLPPDGLAVDLCTGSGAIARSMGAARPGAHVVGTEIDPVAARCGRRNGVVVHEGSLDEALPATLRSRVDVMIGVLPYVPSGAIELLPRDARLFEPHRALDGGPDGLELVAEAVRRSPRWVRRGGWLLLEVGGDQVDTVTELFRAAGYCDVRVLVDDEGDPRGVSGRCWFSGAPLY